MGTSAFGHRVAAGFVACAALLGADLLASPGAAAQTATQPTCSNGTMVGPASSANVEVSSFVCVADLEGDGKLELIVGAQNGGAAGFGHLLILNFKGQVRKRICWGSAAASNCPSVVVNE